MYQVLGRVVFIAIVVINLAMGCSIQSEDGNDNSDTPPNIAGRWAGTWASTTVQQQGSTTLTIAQQ